MARFGLDSRVQIQRISLSVNTLTYSDFAFLIPQIIHLFDRNQIIYQSVDNSEIHSALPQIRPPFKLMLFNTLCEIS